MNQPLIQAQPLEGMPAAEPRASQQQQVLYRKWRPRRFADVSGQAPVTTTLRNAVASGAPAHAYLLTGPRGTGKTSTGRITAKAVNCTAPVEGEPCGECPSCRAYDAGQALDLIELDAASNRGIDEIRDLREAAGYAPTSGRYKVYLIDEVHMLTDAAFNALLKTLEEPPPHVIFILATTEPHKIPATIASRCQRFDFRRIGLEDVVARLRQIGAGEGFEVVEGGYELIARQATGSLRDAVNLLDQLVAYHGATLDLEAVRAGLGLVVDTRAAELARAAVTRDLAAGLAVLAAARDDGVEVRAFVREVVGVLRAVLHTKAGAGDRLAVSDAQAEELRALANESQVGDIVAALEALGDLDFAGDAYDSLPAEIAFAALATSDARRVAPSPAAASEPARPAAAPRRSAPAEPAPRRPPAPRAAQPPSPPRGDGGTHAERPADRRAAPRPPARRPDSEAAATAAAARADVADASPELQSLLARWDQIRDEARRLHFKAGALLNTAALKFADTERVELGFRFANHVEMAREPEIMKAVRDAIGQAAGRPLEVVPVLWEDAQPAASASASPRATGGGHLVEEARRLGAIPADE